jgi:predicted RNA-binding Zn-ribbon protein involved in translation (DUF1610 family)
MDHETLLLDLMAARERIADHPCPWCGAAAWSAGCVVETAMSTVTSTENMGFVYQDGRPVATLQSAVFTCENCQYQATFTLHVQEDSRSF